MAPTIFYFPAIRGRAEPLRLALAAKGVKFEDVAVDFAAMKSDRSAYPFAQCPRFVDDDGTSVCQSNAILRHLQRVHFPALSLAEQAKVDEVVEGVEAIKGKYLSLIYNDNLSEEAKTAFWGLHCDPATASARNGGAHWAFLENLVQRNGSGWAVGSDLTVADLELFDMVDNTQRIWGEQFTSAYPALAALHANVASVPGVATYLSSAQRCENVNNNKLG